MIYVQSRAIHLFLKFIKVLKFKIGIYTKDVLYGLQVDIIFLIYDRKDVLNIRSDLTPTQIQDMHYLLEAIGILVSSGTLSKSEQCSYLETLCCPIVLQLKAISPDDDQYLCALVAYIGTQISDILKDKDLY